MTYPPLAGLRSRFAWALLLSAAATVHGATQEETKPGRNDPIITVISSTVYNGYEHKLTADGKYEQETYAFAEGEVRNGGYDDRFLAKVTFADVARTLVPPLAQQGYVTGRPPAGTKLMIVVHWGNSGESDSSASAGIPYTPPVFVPAATTDMLGNGSMTQNDRPFVDSAITQPGILGGGATGGVTDAEVAFDMMTAYQNQRRDAANRQRAQLLGYDGELARIDSYLNLGGMRAYRADLFSDLEDQRYYVVLVAYDFQKLLKDKQSRVMWVTRFSIRSRGKRFDRDLEAMVKMASRYFGRDSGGLQRDVGGKVRLGELKMLEYEPKK